MSTWIYEKVSGDRCPHFEDHLNEIVVSRNIHLINQLWDTKAPILCPWIPQYFMLSAIIHGRFDMLEYVADHFGFSFENYERVLTSIILMYKKNNGGALRTIIKNDAIDVPFIYEISAQQIIDAYNYCYDKLNMFAVEMKFEKNIREYLMK